MRKEFKSYSEPYDMLVVVRENGLLTIQISEECIINSFEYDTNVKILDKDKVLDEFAQEIVDSETNDGYEDTLQILKLFTRLQDDIVVTSNHIEYLDN